MTAHPCWYEIRLAEPLDPGWNDWLCGLEIVPPEAHTAAGALLRGALPDQAALFGLLARIRDLNLTLLEVRRIDIKSS